MTVSGVATFNPAVSLIITDAYRNVGAIDEEETPTASMYQTALFKLNSMTKLWMASGIHVWTEEEAILFLQAYQFRYVLGGTNDSECCDASSYVTGQLAQNAAAAASSVTLDAATGFVNGARIGVVLDTGYTHWTTINGAPSGDVVALSVALPSSASSGNLAWTYASKIVRPLKVPNARRLQWWTGQPQNVSPQPGYTITPLRVLSRQEYMDLPNPQQPGTPNQVFYSPQRDTGELYVWQPANNANWALRFTWYRPIDDFTTVATTADFPQEWVNPLTWNLTKEMAPSYDVPPARWTMIKEMAEATYDAVSSWDRESEPILFGMDYPGTGAR